MIGTLVLILPSEFTGGAIEIEHDDKRVIYRGHAGKLTLIAFYADCHHQVRPVTAGHRIVLTYNLTIEGDAPTVALPAQAAQVDALAGSIKRYFEMRRPPRWSHDARREAPDRLAYLLDHQYTRRSLAWSRLKNADAARVAALREVAQRLDCEIFLALADVHESWSCEDEEGMFGYHRRRGWRGGYDDEEDGDGEDGDGEDDEGTEAHTLVELLDADIELRHWIALDGRTDAVSGTVDVDEVCWARGHPRAVATTRQESITRRGWRRSPVSASRCVPVDPGRDSISPGGWSRRSGRGWFSSGSSFVSIRIRRSRLRPSAA